MRTLLPVFAVLMAASGSAQTHPDFSGTWKLNVEKSDFGPLPPPASRTDVITQSDAQVKDAVKSVGPDGDMDLNLVYNLDGTMSVSQFRGSDVKSTAKWDGAALAVESKLNIQEQDIGISSRWTLSADGATLTMASHFTSPMGEADTTYVLEKQTGAMAAAAPAAPPAPGAPAAPAAPGAPAAPAAPGAPAVPAAPATPAAPAAPAAPMISGNGPHPNFSGTWKLDVAKSDFGPLPGPESRVDKIEQSDNLVKDTYQAKGQEGDMSGELSYTTDGKESVNKFRGNEMKGTAVWDNAELVVNNKLSMDGNDIEVRTKWDLSADGKTLTMAAHIMSPMGELEQKLVFARQAD